MRKLLEFKYLIVRNISCFMLIITLTIQSSSLCAQSDSAWSGAPSIHLSGFMDIFYTYDFNTPTNGKRQNFLFHHNRHNETNLNLGLIQFDVEHRKYRAVLGFQAGTYPNDNYASEQGIFQSINQAYAGIALDKKNTLWLDAGIFNSNLGFESALSIDNWTLTRSLAAESSPYFLAGAKLTYKPNKNWTFIGLATNGWQRIRRVQGNSLTSFGTQVIYEKEQFTFNWSTFIGTEDPDPVRRMRYFNNLFTQFDLNEQWSLLVGVDIGLQEKSVNDQDLNHWMVPTLIAQYKFNDTWKAAFRAEYFQDEEEIIINNPQQGPINILPAPEPGVNIGSTSLNIDFSPVEKIALRVEGRWFYSEDEFFVTDDFIRRFSKDNTFITASLAIKFGTKISK